MFRKKTSELSIEELKKMKKILLGIFIGLCILWIMILSFMYYNGKQFSVFIAVAVATTIPNLINLMNISNEIKKRESNIS